MKVTIQVQETQKPYRWVTVFSGRVKFADRTLVVVRQCGSTSFYNGDGSMQLAGFSRDHKDAARVPRLHGRWRISPESMVRVTAEVKKAPLVPNWKLRKAQSAPKLIAKSKRPR